MSKKSEWKGIVLSGFIVLIIGVTLGYLWAQGGSATKKGGSDLSPSLIAKKEKGFIRKAVSAATEKKESEKIRGIYTQRMRKATI